MLWLWEDKHSYNDRSGYPELEPSLHRSLSDTWYARHKSSRASFSEDESSHSNNARVERKAILDAGFGISVLAERSSLTLPVVGR